MAGTSADRGFQAGRSIFDAKRHVGAFAADSMQNPWKCRADASPPARPPTPGERDPNRRPRGLSRRY